jgi:chromosome segregation ATPase
MAESSARVHAIEALRDFRGRLIQFTELAQESLGEAQHDLRRTLDWLRHDMVSHWKREVTLTNRKLESARSELFRAEMNAQQSGASTRDERARVKKLEQHLEFCQQKLTAIKKWVSTLEREAAVYDGHTNSLSAALSGDLPKACDDLKVMAAQLDRYVQTALTPDGVRQTESTADDESAEPTSGDESLSP